eukprot:m.259997 g.259997  ORF g.259997 m.259997 type:complete len:442 (+) comp40430_c2_seq47:434-1759(+)
MLLLSFVFLLPFFVFPARGSTDEPPQDSEDGTDGSGIDSSTNASTTQANQTPPASSRIRTSPAVTIVSSGGITIATQMASSAPSTQYFSTKMMFTSSTKTLKQSSVSSVLIPSVTIKTTAEAETSLPSNSSMAFSTAVSKPSEIPSPKASTTPTIYSTEFISSLSATQAAATVTSDTSSQINATSSETTSTSKTASDASQSSTSQPATTLLSPSLIMTTIQTATLTVRKSFLMPSSPITPSPTVSSSTDYSDGSSMLTNTAVQTTTPTSESLMSRSVAISSLSTTQVAMTTTSDTGSQVIATPSETSSSRKAAISSSDAIGPSLKPSSSLSSLIDHNGLSSITPSSSFSSAYDRNEKSKSEVLTSATAPTSMATAELPMCHSMSLTTQSTTDIPPLEPITEEPRSGSGSGVEDGNSRGSDNLIFMCWFTVRFSRLRPTFCF